jgi:Domain of unknown function (DUF4387)
LTLHLCLVDHCCFFCESGAPGNSCDIALFASNMIRRGIDPGLAYHVGHVLECGALACDPGSLIYIDPADLPAIPSNVLVYGRNGVQARPIDIATERELGIIIETSAKNEESAILLASLLTHYIIHYGYPSRRATAGNIAYPLSPNLVSFQREDGTYGAIVPSGTRDPIFFQNYFAIKAAVITLIENEFPDALADASYTITDADQNSPAILLRTVDKDPAQLATKHRQEIEAIQKLATPKSSSLLNLDAADAYEWSLYHLLQNEAIIKETLFPITYFRANGAVWMSEGTARPRYFDIGLTGYTGSVDARSLSLIEDIAPTGILHGSRSLLDMAVVARSKDAGINRLTFDIIFNSPEAYRDALRSNVFHKGNVAKILNLEPERVVGTFFVDSCNAIKISIDRPNISASLDERDVFGAQQQGPIERLMIPMYADKMAKGSSF